MLEHRTVADLLDFLSLSREQFASIHHLDEEPRRHVDCLCALRGQWYEPGRNEQTALRVVLIAALVRDHAFSLNKACAREAMPV